MYYCETPLKPRTSEAFLEFYCFERQKPLRGEKTKREMTTGLFQKYYNTLCCPSKILHKHCYQFLLGLTITPRKIENNTAAKFWRDKKEYDVTFEKGL